MRTKFKRLLCVILTVAMAMGNIAVLPVHAAGKTADAGTQANMDVWVQNSADRAFASSKMPETAQQFIALYSAKNEYEAAQILVRSKEGLHNLSLTATDLTGESGKISSANIEIFSEYSSPASVSGDVEATPDGSDLYTDALIPVKSMDIDANVTQPYWVRVYVPKGQTAGVYSGKVTVTAQEGSVEVPVSVKVYDVTLPDTDESSFKTINWFASAGCDYGWLQNSVPNQYDVEMYDENWWKVMENFAKDLSIHRNNVIFLDVQALLMQQSTLLGETEAAERQEYVTGTDGKMVAGKYLFDWNNFDRMVNLYKDAGAMQYLYLTGNALIQSGDTMQIWVLEEQNGTMARVAKPITINGEENSEAKEWVNVFFKALRSHIQEKYPELLENVYVSALDEPSTEVQNQGSDWYYQAVREVYPETLSIEAHSRFTSGMTESTSLCPALDVYEEYQEYYQGEKEKGRELWYYTCIIPKGDYLNRFIPYHLIKTRLIPWYAYKIGASGYLHWGYSYWGKKDTFNSLQNGDEWLVRPDVENYDVFTSVRSEAQLDGLEDYELLAKLSKNDKAAADRIVNTMIESATSYTKDGSAAMNAHKALLDQLTGQAADPIAMSVFQDNFENGYDYAWNRYVVPNTSWSVESGTYQYHGAGTDALGMTTLRNQTIKNGKISVTVQLGDTYGDNNGMWAGITFRKGDATHNSFVSGYTLALLKNGTMLVFRTPDWRTIAEGVPVTFDSDGKVRLNISMNGNKFVISQGIEEKVLCEFEDAAISEGYISLVGVGADATFSDFHLYTYDGVEEAKVSNQLVKDQSYMKSFEGNLADWRTEGEVTIDNGAMVLSNGGQAGLEGRIFTQNEVNVSLNMDGTQTAANKEDYYAGVMIGKETVYGDTSNYGGYLVRISKNGTIQLSNKAVVIKTASIGTELSGDIPVKISRSSQMIQVSVNGEKKLTAQVSGDEEGFISLCSGGGVVKINSFTVTRNTEGENAELLEDFEADLSKWTKVKEPQRLKIVDGKLKSTGVVVKQNPDEQITGAGTSPELLYTQDTFQNARIGFDVKLDDVALAENWAGAYFHSNGTSGFWTSGGYLLFLTNKGSLTIFKGGANVEIASTTIDADPMKESVHLEMEIVNGTLKVYVNYAKNPALCVEDTTYTSGYFGLCSDWTDATFDNVTYQDLGPCEIEEPSDTVVWNEEFSDDFNSTKDDWVLLDDSAGNTSYKDGKIQLSGISPNTPVTVALKGRAYTSVEVSVEMTIPPLDEGWAGFGVGRSNWNGSVWADGYYLLAMYNQTTGKAELKIYNPAYGYVGAKDIDYEKGTSVKFRMEVTGKNINIYTGDNVKPDISAYAADYEGGFVALCNYAAKNLYDNFSVKAIEDPLVWDEPYEDDFSKDVGNWLNVSDSFGNFEISEGKLTATGSHGGEPALVALKNHEYKNMDVTVDLTLPDETIGWAGITYGRTSWNDRIWDSGYFVTAAQRFPEYAIVRLWKSKGATDGGILLLGEALVSNTSGNALALHTIIKDGKMSVYAGANEEQIAVFQEANYEGGYFALCTYMAQNIYDNFNVKMPEEADATVWGEAYTDDFASDTGNWLNVNQALGSFTFTGGKLDVVGTNGADPEQIALKNRAYKDMDVSVELTLPDAAAGWAGISFGRANWNDRIWDSGYFVTASHNKSIGMAEVRLWKTKVDEAGNIGLVGDVPTANVEYTEGEALPLRIVVKDGKISVYAGSGSEPVTNCQTETYEGGYLALCTYTSQNSYDNFSVKMPGATVQVSGVEISTATKNVTVGEEFTLSANVTPSEASNKKVIWTSSNTKVATVDENGKVTAIGAGEAIITVTTEDGNFTASCTVAVEVWGEVYTDDFTSDSGNWINANSADGNFEISEGKLIAVGNNDGNPALVVLKNRAYSDMDVSVDLTLPDASTGWAGITYGRTNWNDRIWDSGYFVTAAQQDQATVVVRLWKSKGAADGGILLLGEAVLGHTPGEYLTLRAIVKDGKMSVYAGSDQTPVAVFQEDNYEGGYFALCTINAQNSYDNFSVKMPEEADITVWGEAYTDDFASDTGNWLNVNSTWGDFAIIEGKMSAQGIHGGESGLFALKNRAYKEMDVTVDLTVPDKTIGWAGISFGRTNWNDRIWDSGYFAIASHNKVTGKAEITLFKTNVDGAGNIGAVGNVPTATVEYTEGEALPLRIVVKDGKISVYAGDGREPVTTCQTESYEGGYLALCTYNSQNSYDNFSVKMPEATVEVSGVEISDVTKNVTVGEKFTLTATVTPAEATNKKVSWTSSNTEVATVDENGQVTAVAEGEAVITVTTEDGNHTANCTVTVKKASVAAESVTLDTMEKTMEKGETFALTATVLPDDAETSLTWESSDLAVATVQDGLVTAVGKGTATIKVTEENSGLTAECQITVKVSASGVQLSTTAVTVPIGKNTTLQATILPVDASNQNVTWTSSDESVATVDENGQVTAVAVGEAVITVKTEDGEFSAECSVTVTEASEVVESIALDVTEKTLEKGEEFTLTATILPENANASLEWTSSDVTVATVQNGVVTAVGNGTATIKVLEVNTGLEATCNVTVHVSVNGVEISNNTKNVTVGDSFALQAMIKPSDASNSKVTWTTSDESVATVDENGQVTAVGAGEAVITVTTEDGNFTATCTVTVEKANVAVENVTLDTTKKTMEKGSNFTLKATVTPAGATNQKVAWTSSDKAIATVDENGKVTAVAEGKAVITVTTLDGGFSADCEVTVTVKKADTGNTGGSSSDKTDTSTKQEESPKPVEIVIPQKVETTQEKPSQSKPVQTKPVQDTNTDTNETIEQDKVVAVTDKAVQDILEAAEKGTTVTLTLTDNKEESVNIASLTKDSVEQLVKHEAPVVVEFTDASVTFDQAALEAIAAQVEGKEIEIKLVKANENDLSSGQNQVVDNKEVALIITVQIYSDGQYIGDFKGGKATLAVPFEAEEGKEIDNYKVYYIKDDGELIEMDASYVDGCFVFETTHFSEYAVIYEEAAVEETPDDVVETTPEVTTEEDTSANSFPWWIVAVVVVIAVVAVVIFVRKNDRKNKTNQ